MALHIIWLYCKSNGKHASKANHAKISHELKNMPVHHSRTQTGVVSTKRLPNLLLDEGRCSGAPLLLDSVFPPPHCYVYWLCTLIKIECTFFIDT